MQSRRRSICGLICVGLLLLVLAGCANTPWYPGHNWNPWKQTEMDKRFGVSYKQALSFQQAYTPAEEDLLKPVEGIDGKSAEKALERLRKGFEEKQAAPTYILNVGSGAGVK